MRLVKWSVAVLAVIGVLVTVWQWGPDDDPVAEDSAEAVTSDAESANEPLTSPGGDHRANRTQTAVTDGISDTAPDATSMNWTQIEDVDALVEELREELANGNAQAGWRLHELASKCFKASLMPSQMGASRKNRMDPETRAAMQAQLDQLAAMKEPCLNSEFGDRAHARSVEQEALREAAEAGHVDAKYRLVFRSYMSGNRAPPANATGDEEDWQAIRRETFADLRDACHEGALSSMGIHLSMDSGVVEGLLAESLPGHDESSSRQIQAFGYRYAAAELRDEERPAHAARNPDYPLTAYQERQAVELAESMINGCR